MNRRRLSGRDAVVLLATIASIACDAARRDPVAAIAGVKLARRTVEGRLCGFAWAPLQPTVRGEAASIDPRLAEAMLEVSRSRENGPGERHAVALGRLLTDSPRNAVTTLASLAATTSDARVWNDFAAARYTARSGDRPEDLFPALVAVDTALRIDSDLPEARFNRALIVERLALHDSAIHAWQHFLKTDSASEWAIEARSHLRALSVSASAPDFSPQAAAQLAAHPDEARRLVRSFPQEARLAAEREILDRWGAATLHGDDVAADRELTLASIIGNELSRQSGDRMVERAVAAIRNARGKARRSLASGHVGFTSALKTFRSGRSAEALPAFVRAASELEAGESPFALTARFFAGYARYETGDVAESTRELQELLAKIPSDLLTCRATLQWQLSICFAAQHRWGEDIEGSLASLAAFERAGEVSNAAMLCDELAESHELIGDDRSAWNYRAKALPALGRTSNRFLQAILGFLSQSAIFRRDWPLAASMTEIELDVGTIAHYEPGLSDAHLRRALTRHFLGNGDPSDDIALARSIAAAIPDSGMRTRLDARRVAVEAMVARTSAEAVPLLSAAIEFQSSARGQRMYLPSLYLYRARAERALRQMDQAQRDLDAGLAEFDGGRTSLDSPDQRLGMFDSASGILDEAIDLALERNDAVAAFGYAEHARARTLLDQVRHTASPGLQVRTGATLIEYATLPSRVVIFVVQGAQIFATSRAIDRETLAARVAAFSEALQSGAADTATGSSLYRDLIAPVERRLPDGEELVIVPDVTIAPVAFAALRTPNGKFLIEKHVLAYSPSAAVFAQTTAQRAGAVRDPRLLLVANDRASEGLSALPKTSEETRRISGLYRDTCQLSGPSASREAFIREAPRAGVIHFAGHALWSDFGPDETCILLGSPDGKMSVRDIARLPLRRSPIVVLAACGTARGKTWRYEGALSVARAFLAAGSSTVVATLWRIDDGEASVFFPVVHEGLARGLSPANALRTAQIQAIGESRSTALWAAVQTIGSD